MTLTTRPKPKLQHKKRQARHHRHSKHYVKTYWPYLPMLVIVGLGYIISDAWDSIGLSTTALNLDAATMGQASTRVEVLAGSQSTLVLTATLALAGLAFAWFVFRHWRLVHQWVNNSERFISHHPLLDIVLVTVFTTGFVLTRPAGLI